MNEVAQERKKLTWFLVFVSVVLILTGGTDLIMSFFGSPHISKERNPFVTTPSKIPTPFFTPFPTASASNAASQTAKVTQPPTPTEASMKACTMDAKMCPDGKTFVGRSGPNCEFIACPKKEKRTKNKE
jgi:flagellar basal body-associated protein FliL